MATYWWIRLTASGTGNWNDSANWSSTEGGAGGAGIPGAADNAYFSDTSGSAPCQLTANAACTNLYTLSANTGGTDNWDGTLNLQTYNLDVSNEFRFGGVDGTTKATFQIGISSDTGLTVGNGFYLEDYTVTNWNRTGSKLNITGDCQLENYDMAVSDYSGVVTLSGTGNFSNPRFDNAFNSLTILSGASITCVGDCWFSNGANQGTLNIAGAINANGQTIYIEGSGSGTVTFENTCNITGNGIISLGIRTGCTVNQNKTGTFGFSGDIWVRNFSSTTLLVPSFDMSNADILFYNQSSNQYQLLAGTVKCIDFKTSNYGASDAVTIDNTNNTNIECSGDFDLSNGDVTYNRGTGIIYMKGTGNLSSDGNEIEGIILNNGASSNITVTSHSYPKSVGMLNSSILDVGVYNLGNDNSTSFACGAADITIGVSSDVGLNFSNYQFTGNFTKNWQKLSKITTRGSFIMNDVDAGSPYTGSLFIKGSGNMMSQRFDNAFSRVTQDAGVTTTLVGDVWFTNGAGSDYLELNGTIDTDGNRAYLESSNLGEIVFGSGFSMAGSGVVQMGFREGCTITNNRTGTCGFPGTIEISNYSDIFSLYSITGDFPNATYLLDTNVSQGSRDFLFMVGTLKVSAFLVGSTTNNDINIDFSTNNPTIECSGDVNFSYDTGTFDVTVDEGTSEFKLTKGSGNATIDMAGVTLYTFSVDDDTNQKLIVSDFSCNNISSTNGDIRSSSDGVQRTITVSNSGSVSNVTFKDISVGSVKVGAKDNCTNLGNNLGIIFNDKLIV